MKIRLVIWLLLGSALLMSGTCRGQLNPRDFANEVISYVPGSGIGNDQVSGELFNDPNMALGVPTSVTTGDGFDINPTANVPVIPIFPSFRAHELVSVGVGGELVIKFDHPVANDKNNLYGIDFIVFGNATHKILSGGPWKNGDPTQFTVKGDMIADQGIVSVSQDGRTWYSFTDGPYADDFAATLGRRFAPRHPDMSLGEWNQWWAGMTDPTIPLDPSLSRDDFHGKTVAEVATLYGASAGGTGFDLADVGLEWIFYVKIEAKGSFPPEIDAISDVSSCGDYKNPLPAGDINGDCRVDMEDLAILASNWMTCTMNCNDLQ